MIAASAGGYAASLHTIGVRPRAVPRVSAACARDVSSSRERGRCRDRGGNAARSASRSSSAASAVWPSRSRSPSSRHVQTGRRDSATKATVPTAQLLLLGYSVKLSTPSPLAVMGAPPASEALQLKKEVAAAASTCGAQPPYI